MYKIIMLIAFSILLQGCFSPEYELKKYYKDPDSPAAKMMGGTFAGIVETFNSLEACMQMKEQAEMDDRRINYTNSRFICDEK